MELLETLLIPALTVLLSLSASWIVLRRVWNRPPAWVSDLFTPLDEKGTTKLDTWITRAVDVFFTKIKFGGMGEISGQSRLEKGLQNAVMDDVINSQSPILGMIIEQFPQVKSYLMKHPNAIPQVLGMLAPLLQGQGLKNMFGAKTGSASTPNPFKVE